MAPRTRKTVFCLVSPMCFRATPPRSRAFQQRTAAALRELHPSFFTEPSGCSVERGTGGVRAAGSLRWPPHWTLVSGDAVATKERALWHLFPATGPFTMSAHSSARVREVTGANRPRQGLSFSRCTATDSQKEKSVPIIVG